MKETIKIREFIKREIDIDVYDDVCEEICIAFCGPVELTAEGEKVFKDVLELDITIYDDMAVINLDEHPDWERKFVWAKKFFYAAAGYCSVPNFNLWFKSGE